MAKIKVINTYTQEIKKDKQTFLVTSSEINGKWYKVKFTKSAGNVITEKGLGELKINLDDCSLEYGKEVAGKNGKKYKSNDIIWVRKAVDYRPLTEEELRAMEMAKFDEVFGDD